MPCPITLYISASPNAHRASILLELLGLKYAVKQISLAKGEQKEPWFLQINPDGKIPALKDDLTGVSLGQSGAIMQYLAEAYDKDFKFTFAPGTKESAREKEIFFVLLTELGPPLTRAGAMMLMGEKDMSVLAPYLKEAKRVLGVLETYLKGNEASGPFFAGKHYSLADISIFPFFNLLDMVGIDKSEYPALFKWHGALSELPAVQKGLLVSQPH